MNDAGSVGEVLVRPLTAYADRQVDLGAAAEVGRRQGAAELVVPRRTSGHARAALSPGLGGRQVEPGRRTRHDVDHAGRFVRAEHGPGIGDRQVVEPVTVEVAGHDVVDQERVDAGGRQIAGVDPLLPGGAQAGRRAVEHDQGAGSFIVVEQGAGDQVGVTVAVDVGLHLARAEHRVVGRSGRGR